MFTMMKVALISTCLLGAATVATSPSINNLGVTSQTVSVQTISIDQAKDIAVSNQGLPMDEVTFTKVCEEYDDGCHKIKITYVHGDTEYDYEIDAVSGVILDVSFESIYDD